MTIIPLYAPNKNQLIPDSSGYLNYADHFIHHLNHDVVRTPGYPLLLLILKQASFVLNSPLPALVYFTQSFLFLFGIFLLSEIVRRSLGKKAAIFFVIFLAFNPGYFVYNFLILTEPLFFFLLCTTLYFFYRFFMNDKGCIGSQLFQSRVIQPEREMVAQDLKNEKNKAPLRWFNSLGHLNIYLSLLSACLATLTRPGFYYLNLLYFIVLLVILWRRKRILPIFVCATIYSTSILSIQLNFYSNHQLFKISMIDVITRHRYLRNAISCEISGEDRLMQLDKQDSIDNRRIQTDFAKGNQKALYDYYQKQWKMTIEGHKALAFQVYCHSILENIHSGNNLIPQDVPEKRKVSLFHATRIWNMFLVILFALQMLYLAIFGIRKLMQKEKRSLVSANINLSGLRILCFISFLVVYQILSSGVSFWQGDRLFITSQPFILLMCFLIISTVRINKKVSID